MYLMATQTSSHLFLICRNTVSVDNRASDRVCFGSASVSGVALNGIYGAVLAFLNDTGVVCHTVALPVKEDDCTGRRFIRSVCPLSSVSEPLYAVYTTGILRNNTGVDISALVGTPRNKAGTPLYTGVKSVPRPVNFSLSCFNRFVRVLIIVLIAEILLDFFCH